jgi:regulatory protein
VEETQRAYAYALKALTRRDHSEAELRRKLGEREISSEVVEETIGRLKESRYLDDGRFARHWAESAVRNGKGYGFRIRFELTRRGIDDKLAEDIVAQLSSEYGEADTLQALVARKFPGFDPHSTDDRRKRRIIGYLQRRGFSLAAILNALRDMEGV